MDKIKELISQIKGVDANEIDIIEDDPKERLDKKKL